MKYGILSLVICCLIGLSAEEQVPDVELPAAVERAIDRYAQSMEDAQEALLQAQSEFQEDALKAQKSLVSALERSVNNRLSIPEQVAIYRLILTHDSEHQAARQFFGVLGNLDEMLADINEEAENKAVTTDIFGNPVLTASALQGQGFSGSKAKEASVQSTNLDGVTLGSFQKGQTLVIQYVSGQWTPNKNNSKKRPLRNPDLKRPNNKYGIGLFVYSKERGNWSNLRMIPMKTAESPFRYTFEEDVEGVAIRMADHTPENNSGTVVYRIAVEND